jgi:hypothetical protein
MLITQESSFLEKVLSCESCGFVHILRALNSCCRRKDLVFIAYWETYRMRIMNKVSLAPSIRLQLFKELMAHQHDYAPRVCNLMVSLSRHIE